VQQLWYLLVQRCRKRSSRLEDEGLTVGIELTSANNDYDADFPVKKELLTDDTNVDIDSYSE
jgi:hypothetical protein